MSLYTSLGSLGSILLGFGMIASVPAALWPASGPCSATVLNRFPPGSGYSLLCTGSCATGLSCSPRNGEQEPIGEYKYCPLCTEGHGADEPNCCHPVVQKNEPYGKYALGVCHGETGGDGCDLLGPCAWSQPPNDLQAKCQGGLPPEEG